MQCSIVEMFTRGRRSVAEQVVHEDRSQLGHAGHLANGQPALAQIPYTQGDEAIANAVVAEHDRI